MNASQIRKQAEALSIEAADALAEVEGLEQLLANLDGMGERDVQELRERLRKAEDWLSGLLEQEHHAWDAYNYASQAEYAEYLAEQYDL